MSIDYKKEEIIVGKKRFPLALARAIAIEQFPHVVTANQVKSEAKGGRIFVSVDWRNVFSKPEIKMTITSKLIKHVR